ncbi:MAG: CHAT domain-containing protein [Hyphomicrobiales bacterium]
MDSGPELWELKNRLFKTQRHICPPLAHLSAVDAQATMNGTVSFSLFGFDEAFINVEPASSLKIAIEGGLLINNRGFGDEINFNGFWDGRSRELWPFRAEVENAPSVLEFMLVTIRQFHKDGQVQNAFNALTHLNHLAETWMTQNWTRNGAALGGDQGRVKSVLRQSLQYWMLLSSQQQALKDKPLFAEAFKAAQLAQLGDVSLAIQAGLRQSITTSAETRLLVEELEEKAHAVKHYKSIRDALAATPITDGFELAVSKAEAELEVAQENARELLPIIEQYSEIAPVSIEQIKAKLKPGEAFLFFVPVGNGTAAFFSTSTTSAFYSVGIPAAQMNVSIEALRKGLDPENVTKGLHDFDPVLAHTLYQHLFGPLVNVASNVKHFLVVAEGGLASLPLQVLLKSPPTKDAQGFLDLRNLDWFVKHHAVTTLTSPRNMIAQGQRSSLGTPKQPMIGFGDPVFKNGQTHIDQNQNTGSSLRAIRPNQLLPLPETRDELKHVAKITKARDSDLFFGDAANEKVIKSLNKANRLSDYSILYFATHGALPGELDGFLEPGLILTQPSRLTAEDDGYLSASEIASLRLNADWVVLSACNTAGEGKAGNQSLSGLAKAFFKAGAKSLLVSHWEVISTAAVELTGETFKALASQETTSRAEALRLAMIRVMNDRSNSAKAHPAYWAPFAVVGASS